MTAPGEATCTYCGGSPSAGAPAADWYDDEGSWYCPGCRKIVGGSDPAGLIDSARGDYAAARTLIRACDEIDDLYRRVDGAAAAAESEPLRHAIEEVGRALEKLGGEKVMRRALLLVQADCDPDHLIAPLAGGKVMDPARKATVTSHKQYIEREWNGIGTWQA